MNLLTDVLQDLKPIASEVGNYWEGEGKYQQEFDSLYTQHVPRSGRASSVHGELLRAISRLTHEFANNGNGNAAEWESSEEEVTCDYCHGTGELEDYYNEDTGEMETIVCGDCDGEGYNYEQDDYFDCIVSPFFEEFLTLIEEEVSSTHPDIDIYTDAVRDLICSHPGDQERIYFTPESFALYAIITNYIVEHIQQTEDRELSRNYAN